MNWKSALLLILIATPPAVRAGSSSQKLDFEKAVLLEEASGKLEEAIALYRKVAAGASDEALAAQAQLRVGMCYEKLGKQEARSAYQRVLDRFPAQKEAVFLARERLARLDAGRMPAGRTVTVREFLRGGEYSVGKISDPTIGAGEFTTTSDGRMFVYTDWNTGDLIVNDFSTGETRALYGVNWLKSTEFFEAPVLSPDEKKVAYLNVAWPNQVDVFRIQIDSLKGGSRETVYEAKDSADVYPYDWSPDGQTILATLKSTDGSVSLIAVDVKNNHAQRIVTLNWEGPLRAEYSPDGRYIAYDSTKYGERKIYLMTADGREEHTLIDSAGEDHSPIWSPDGRFLIFISSRSGDSDLLGIPIAQGRVTGDPFVIKTNIGANSTLRSITKDGRLFYDELVSGGDVVIAQRDNREDARVLPKINSRANRNLVFSPDGKHLAYVGGGFGRQTGPIRIATLDGKTVREIVLDPQFRPAQNLQFSPDGTKLAVAVYDQKRGEKTLLISTETGETLKALSGSSEAKHSRLAGWSGDGQAIYLALQGQQAKEQFAAVDIHTDRMIATSLPGPSKIHRVSRDGKWLIYVGLTLPRQEGEEHEARLILRSIVDGSEKVLQVSQDFVNLVWDFDSRHVFYRKGQGEHLYRCSIETGTEEVFLETPKGILRSVSPDGKYLAFQTRARDVRIWVVENFLPKGNHQIATR